MNVPIDGIVAALIERTNNICFVFGVQNKKFVYLSPSLEFFFRLIDENVKDNCNLLLNRLYEDDVPYAFENYKKIFEQGSVEDVVLRILLPDNEVRTLKLEAWLLEIDGVEYIAGLADDITD